MSLTNAIFTGSSAYSQDLQNVISRSVAIASLPIQQLTADQTALSGQSSEFSVLDQKVASVQSSLDGVRQALDASFDASVSATDVLSACTSAGAAEGTYSVLAVDAGAYSTMMTKTWTAASGAPHTYRLKLGAEGYDVTPADNSAASVAAAINQSYGDLVRATVVNVGPADTPDYRLSLQSVALTSDVVDLEDGASLHQIQTPGKAARYQVNGSGITVSSASRTVRIADGLTVTLKSSAPDPITVSVSRSTTGLNTALGVFTTAYNALVSELDNQRGAGAGALVGNPVVAEVASVLAGIGTFTAAGRVSGLADLGVQLGSDGKLTQDTAVLPALNGKSPGALSVFLSSFLDAADGALAGVHGSEGLIESAKTACQTQLDAISKRIDDKQAQVDELQRRLESQMAAADAMLASMQQQYSYLSNMFAAMQTASAQNK